MSFFIITLVKRLFEIFLLTILITPTQALMFSSYKSLDGAIHALRIKEFHIALINGQIPPRLAPTIIDSIAYPLFTVNYQLPFYLAEPIMALTNNPLLAYKLVMSLTFIAGSLFAYLLFKELFSTQSAFVGMIIYTYLPYRFGNLYQRGALGESVSLTFVPLIFLSLHLTKNDARYSVPLLAFALFGLITSHSVMFLIFAPAIILYSAILLKPNTKQAKRVISGFLLGLMLSAFQLVPSILEKKFMTFESNLSDLYKDFFSEVFQLFRIPKSNLNLGTHYQIGVTSTVILVAGIFSLIRKQNRTILFFLFFAFLSIYMTTAFSEVFWKNVKPLSYVIYPYRFLNLTIFSVAFLAAALVSSTRRKTTIAFLLIALTIYTNRHYFTIEPWFEIPPPPNLTTLDENNTIWQNENTYKNRPLLTPTNDGADIKISTSNPYKIVADINAPDQTSIIIRKMYFPGWQLKINNEKQNLRIKDGLIELDLKTGYSHLELYFSETLTRKTANSLTLVAIVISLYLVFTDFKTSYGRKKAKK